jgi:2,4-dienoyl-CoA reductase-like NADH-dependent reductase (Old Yellow Enzyme family)
VSKLFEQTKIKNMALANRFVRSATWEGMAQDDGSCTPALIEVAVRLARGGIGLIITGHAFVSEEGRAGRWQMGVYSDALLPGLTQMAGAVHDAGGKIVMQIAHAGSRASARLTGLQSISPSLFEQETDPTSREMHQEDITRVTKAFAQAAVRARAAGFDGIQIHGAHGYLLNQFLSPFFNKRKDAYGGTIENRTRMVLEVLRSIQEAAGPDFPVLIKLNSEDFLEGGFTVDDMLATSRILEQAGIDAIEMSGGTILSAEYIASRKGKLDSEDQEVYYREAARRFKEKVRVPLMLVGGIRSYTVAERLATDGTADYISMCRPLIREPALVNRWKSGDLRKALCISDNGCFKPAFQGRGITCVVEEALKQKG